VSAEEWFMPDGVGPKLRLPELLLGLIAVALAVVVTGVSVAHAVRDVKRARDTITVTCSAREPITSNVVHWSLAVDAEAVRPQGAVRQVQSRAAAVRAFLHAAACRRMRSRSRRWTRSILLGVGKRRVPGFRVVQRFRVSSTDIDRVEAVAARMSDLLAQGIPVSTTSLSYLATKLADAKIRALKRAVADAHRHAETIVAGIDGKLGSVKSAELGVYQVMARNSTNVSDYGINDTASRDKEVYSVVIVTFRVRYAG
jgi:hypothetical protein